MLITNRGRPSHVLLTIEDYQRLTGTAASIVELLAMPGAQDIEMDVPRVRGLYQAADLSL